MSYRARWEITSPESGRTPLSKQVSVTVSVTTLRLCWHRYIEVQPGLPRRQAQHRVKSRLYTAQSAEPQMLQEAMVSEDRRRCHGLGGSRLMGRQDNGDSSRDMFGRFVPAPIRPSLIWTRPYLGVFCPLWLRPADRGRATNLKREPALQGGALILGSCPHRCRAEQRVGLGAKR